MCCKAQYEGHGKNECSMGGDCPYIRRNHDLESRAGGTSLSLDSNFPSLPYRYRHHTPKPKCQRNQPSGQSSSSGGRMSALKVRVLIVCYTLRSSRRKILSHTIADSTRIRMGAAASSHLLKASRRREATRGTPPPGDGKSYRRRADLRCRRH